MGLKQDQIIRLCEQVIICPLMLAFHLNDNDINTDNKFMLRILDIFGLGEEDLLDTNRSIKNQRLVNPNNNQSPMKNQIENFIDYKTIMRVYMGFQPQRFVDKQALKGEEAIQVQRKIYKDHILLGKNQKIVDNLKAINSSQVSAGIGKLDDNEVDQFVVSRIVNYPELIFNQRIKNDTSKKGHRFFQKDAGMKWELSKQNECYVCQKHRYTIIFYERGIFSENEGLVEIQDRVFLEQLRTDFQKNYITYKSMTPVICGTVVNKLKGTPQFSRKLKMMRASIFTLMCISGSRTFISERYQTHKLKNGCIRFLDFDNIDVLDGMNIKEKLDGWQQVLNDKCNFNELTDVTKINPPNFEDDMQRKDIFIFAGFLPPGYHQLLIYDPENGRAYVKDFIVGLNNKDFYPEFPLLHGTAAKFKTVQNVWRNWVEDTEEDCIKSFKLDTEEEEFNISTFLKNPEDAKKCLDLLLENFNMLKVYQKELLVGSSKYPQVDFDRCCQFIEWVHNNTDIKPKHKFQRAQIELCFIRATRFDETSGLKSAMQRMELYEFILRLGQSWSYSVYSAREMVSDHLMEFFEVFIKPVTETSHVMVQRSAMRQSTKLNELLYDNIKGLEAIFEENKNGGKYFTQDSAVNCFMRYPICAKKLTLVKIQQCFVFSQMTVLDEIRNLRRYGYLEFVEFLDMLCRVAQIVINIQDTIENKVYEMLSYIYLDRYNAGIWNEDDYPLIEVNDDVDC